jgi:casein kinase II subunit beta
VPAWSQNMNWIRYHCNLQENRFLVEIDKPFIEDAFNLFGLKQMMPEEYMGAMGIILDKKSKDFGLMFTS